MKHDCANTKNEIEEYVNTVLIPKLNQLGLSSDEIEAANRILFFYRVGRMTAIEALVRLVLIHQHTYDPKKFDLTWK